MTAALVSEHRFGRQSSVLSPWRVPQARYIERECSSFNFVSINQFTIFVFIDPYIPTRTYTSGVLTRRSYSHFRRTYVPLVHTHPAYLCAARTHTSGVLTRRSYSHALRGFVVLRVSVMPGVLSSRSSYMPSVGFVSSWYPSRPVCSHRSFVKRLAWARCTHGIHHAWLALVGLLTRLARACCSYRGWWLQRWFKGRER